MFKKFGAALVAEEKAQQAAAPDATIRPNPAPNGTPPAAASAADPPALRKEQHPFYEFFRH